MVLHITLLPLMLVAHQQPQTPWKGALAPIMDEGIRLLNARKLSEAAEKFREGMRADRESSWPYSGLAQVYLAASRSTTPEHVEEYRRLAEQCAFDALERYDGDFMASQVLKGLKGGSAESRHTPDAKAKAVFDEAESLFQTRKFAEAADVYAKALALDPSYTDACLYGADCYYDLNDYEKAERLFRKATEMEPTYARAWRFLADCYGKMGRIPDMERASLGAIAAEPDDFAAWVRLNNSREAQVKPVLTRFKWPKVTESKVTPGKKKDETNIVLSFAEGEGPDESAMNAYTLSLALGQVIAKDAKKALKGDELKTPFQLELDAWTSAVEVIDRAIHEEKKDPKNPAWRQLLAMKKAGHLQSAVILLHFRESYRKDFEAWRKAKPKAMEEFIEAFKLRP